MDFSTLCGVFLDLETKKSYSHSVCLPFLATTQQNPVSGGVKGRLKVSPKYTNTEEMQLNSVLAKSCFCSMLHSNGTQVSCQICVDHLCLEAHQIHCQTFVQKCVHKPVAPEAWGGLPLKVLCFFVTKWMIFRGRGFFFGKALKKKKHWQYIGLLHTRSPAYNSQVNFC